MKMTRRSKTYNFSDIFENIDLEVAGVLRKCDSGRSYDSLPQKEKDKLWKALLKLIETNNLPEANDDNVRVVKAILEVMLSIFNFSESNLEKCKPLIDILVLINSKDFVLNTPSVVNFLSKVNEYWMAKVQETEEIPGMEYFTLKHLLTLCTGDKVLNVDIQRLGSIRKAMTLVPFEQMVPSLKPLLIKVVEMPLVISSEHGQRFIAQSLTLSEKLMMDIHKTIMLELGTCNKKKADSYGKIYVVAWHNASEEMKPLLEKFCFQHLMEKFMKEQRTSLELSKSSQNILAVLEAWHSERSKKNPEFITMITDAYQPILWKYLQSGFNMYRCNAADVLFKAFPLQRSKDNAVEAENLFNMQYEAMLACLTDDCHIVRIIGIREVCNIISHYWNSFNSAQIQSLLKVITKENASDSSTAEVRRMVYIGFQSLVKSPLSCDYMKQILPLIGNNIHDVNQRVRIAFIQLLRCIKDKKDPNFKYSDVVSMGNIQYRLADDNATVGQWIVELLMKNYYHSKMAVVEWTKRFIHLIKTYRNSYRNFFFYSGKCLPFEDACIIIYEIITQLGMFVLSKSGSDKEDSENIIEKPTEKRKGNKKIPLSDSNGRRNSGESRESNSSKKCAFDDPEVVAGLFDVVTILWVLHDIELNKPENEEMRFKLYETYIKYAQPFINYYKDSDLFLGIISLSGNIPASLLRNNSITLPGYCIKILKSCNLKREEEDREKIMCMLMALVKWGRGRDIMELVTLWLDAAFETQNMNETILPRRRVRINETIQPNSVVAINILDTLLKMEYAKLSILKKNYAELFQLWRFMSRVKQLIEARLELAEPFEDDLVSDEFLIVCFRRYVKLIPLLKEEHNREEEENKENESAKDKEKEGFVNRQKEMENLLEWATHLLYPSLEKEDVEEPDLNLVVTLLQDILYVSDNMIIVHFVNHFFHFKLGHFILKLLDTKHAVRFVKASSRITTALNHSAKLLFNVSDDLKIFSTVVPSLMSHTLNTLAMHEFTPKEMKQIEEDMPVIRSNLGKILATYQDNLKQTSNLKEKARQLKLVVGFFVDCIVHLVVKSLPKVGDEFGQIPEFSSPSQLPPLASNLMALFHNKKTWTSLFIHLLSGKISRGEEVRTIVATLLLLHMYAVGDKKVNRDELKKLLTIASKTLADIKKSPNASHRVGRFSSLFVFEEKSNTDTHGLQPMSVDGQENTSKEVLASCNRTRDESGDGLNISNYEKYSDEHYVNHGLDLIKDIETILKNQNGEEDDS